jgi:hypothetical protein
MGTGSGGTNRFLRLEIRPGVALPEQPLTAGARVQFSGPVMIDMDLQQGGLLNIGYPASQLAGSSPDVRVDRAVGDRRD